MEGGILSESPTDRRDPGGPVVDSLSTFDAIALRLLDCLALAVFCICLLILPNGPSESTETLSWALAFAIAIPGGFAIAAYQERRLVSAAPAAASRGFALAALALVVGLLLRRFAEGDSTYHLVMAAAAALALVAPLLAARVWQSAEDRAGAVGYLVLGYAVAVGLVLFFPAGTLQVRGLLFALAFLAVALLALRLRERWLAPLWLRRVVDVAICAGIVLAVAHFPDIRLHAGDLAYHQNYFLGPANDVVHGRAMVSEAWSQYGVAAIDGLGLLFSIVPIGFGTLSLAIAGLMVAQYLVVYAILRLAGVGQVLAAITLVVAVAGNVFWPLDTYVSYPSGSALRFGIPYLMVLFALLGARRRAMGRAGDAAVLLLLAISAAWSFETFVYCVGAYGAMALVEALAAGGGVLRRLARRLALGAAAAVAGLAVFSLATLVLTGDLDWGPYFEYLDVYTAGGLSQLPVVVFSPGPLMAAAIFLSAVALLWLTRYRRAALEPSVRLALAGLIGFAIATFTYYLGRSHPNNLLVLMVPTLMVSALWVHCLTTAPGVRWKSAAAAPVLLAWGLIVAASGPSISAKWHDSAFGLLSPWGDASLGQRVSYLAGNPVFSPLAPEGVALLDAQLPAGQPALVLADSDLATEILMRSDRRNLLPISHASEDALIPSSGVRVAAAVARVPVGEVMLVLRDPVPADAISSAGGPVHYDPLQQYALDLLAQRFELRRLAATESGLELVRLAPRRG